MKLDLWNRNGLMSNGTAVHYKSWMHYRRWVDSTTPWEAIPAACQHEYLRTNYFYLAVLCFYSNRQNFYAFVRRNVCLSGHPTKNSYYMCYNSYMDNSKRLKFSLNSNLLNFQYWILIPHIKDAILLKYSNYIIRNRKPLPLVIISLHIPRHINSVSSVMERGACNVCEF